jgi:hypothetical protein
MFNYQQPLSDLVFPKCEVDQPGYMSAHQKVTDHDGPLFFFIYLRFFLKVGAL